MVENLEDILRHTFLVYLTLRLRNGPRSMALVVLCGHTLALP